MKRSGSTKIMVLTFLLAASVSYPQTAITIQSDTPTLPPAILPYSMKDYELVIKDGLFYIRPKEKQDEKPPELGFSGYYDIFIPVQQNGIYNTFKRIGAWNIGDTEIITDRDIKIQFRKLSGAIYAIDGKRCSVLEIKEKCLLVLNLDGEELTKMYILVRRGSDIEEIFRQL